MALEDVFYEVRDLLDDDEFEEAEELLVSYAEQPAIYGNWAGSFINTLVYSILIPQGRLREAYAWLDDSIQMDAGYETWNSISNLGHLTIRLGNFERAEKLFNLMKQAETGPLDEAEEFLEMMYSGDAEDLVADVIDNSDTKLYIAFYDYLLKNPLDDGVVQTFRDSRGGATHGFIKGVFESDSIDKLEPTHDAIAQVLWDYMTQERLGKLPSYEDCLAAAKAGRVNSNHKRVLREAAIEGSGEAAFLLYETLRDENLNYLPWLNVAKYRGFKPKAPSEVPFGKENRPRMF